MTFKKLIRKIFRKDNARLYGDVGAYITENLVVPKPRREEDGETEHVRYSLRTDPEIRTRYSLSMDTSFSTPLSLDRMVRAMEKPTFSGVVKEHMDKKGITPGVLYKRVPIDRKLYSRLNTEKRYQPSKDKAVLFCIGLQLSLDESEDLLEKAGYTLSMSIRRDIIIRYMLVNKIYDMYDINDILLKYGEKILE